MSSDTDIIGSSVSEQPEGTISSTEADSVTSQIPVNDDVKPHGDMTQATSDLRGDVTPATSDLGADGTQATSDLGADGTRITSDLGADGTQATSDLGADGTQATSHSDVTRATSDSGGDVCIDLTLDSSPMASLMSEVSMDSSGLEEPLTPATDNSEKSGSVSGRLSPGSQSDQSATFSSSEKSTPRKRHHHSGADIMADMDNLSNSSGSVKGVGSNPPQRMINWRSGERVEGGRQVGSASLPQRIGINWRSGERLEAMDYMHKWFPAKIRDINRQDLQVLIHFDGWNQRFDEWVDMTSGRIRPLIRHSGRKDRGQTPLRRDYRVGEQVYAKWTDCKMYPAKIIGHLQNGSYEVIFYDGFKKQVQPINVRPVPGEAKRKIIEVSPPPIEAVKKIKMKGYNIDVVTGDTPVRPQISSKTKGEYRKRPSTDSESHHPVTKQKKTKRALHTKLVPTPLKADGTEPGMALSEPVSTQTDYTQSVGIKPDIVEAIPSVTSPGMGPSVTSPGPGPSVTSPGPGPVFGSEPSVELSSGASIGLDSGPSVVPGVGTASDCFITHTTSASKHQQVARPYVPPIVPRKAFVVESDHNRYKCQYEGCNKGFRKEHLLEYHIKYYHIDNGGTGTTTPQPAKGTPTTTQPAKGTPTTNTQPAKKRRKTICIGSPESGASHSGKKSSQKKNRHVSESCLVTEIKQEVKEEPLDDHFTHAQPGVTIKQETGEISTQTTPTKYSEDHSLIDDTSITIKQEMKLEGKHHRTTSQDSYLTEESSVTDAEEFLKPDELVNCICDFYEENGLMIQCEVCMCWQHASCFGITDRTLPKTYVCFVCENPPGVRDSSRYIHEQDWLKTGEMATFSYLDFPPPSPGRCGQIKATHSLIADVQRLNTVLDSLKLQLNVLRTKDVEKMKMWRVDWDMLMQDSKSSVEEDQAMGEQTNNSEITDTVVKQEDESDTKPEAAEGAEQVSKDGSMLGKDNTENDIPKGEVATDAVQDNVDIDVHKTEIAKDAVEEHVISEIGASSDVKDKGFVDESGNKENNRGLNEAGGQEDDFELKLELTDDDEDDKAVSTSKEVKADKDTGKADKDAGIEGPEDGAKEEPNLSNEVACDEGEKQSGEKQSGEKQSGPVSGEVCQENTTSEQMEVDVIQSEPSVESSDGKSQQDLPQSATENMDVTGDQSVNGETAGNLKPQSDGGEELVGKEERLKAKEVELKEEGAELMKEGAELKKEGAELKEEGVELKEEGMELKKEGAEMKEEGMEIKIEVEEGSHSDSTESALEDPIEVCERNLLNHILRVQAAISERFNLLEEQISYLEALEASNSGRPPPSATTVLSDVPQIKRTTRAMEGDLCKVRKMSVFH